MRIGLLRFTAELRLGLTRRLRGCLGWRGRIWKRLVSCLCPPCKVRTVGTFVYGVRLVGFGRLARLWCEVPGGRGRGWYLKQAACLRCCDACEDCLNGRLKRAAQTY